MLDYRDKIQNYLDSNNGLITTDWVAKQNIPRVYLTRLVREGYLKRIARGLYASPSGDYDTYYFFQKQKPRCIYSYSSALTLLEMTEIIPQQVEVTVYSGYNIGSIPDNVIVHYVKKDLYRIGIVSTKTMFGNMVKTYSMERTVCDLVQNREKIEAELFSKSLKAYSRLKSKNILELFKIAELMNVKNEVQDIMEILHE